MPPYVPATELEAYMIDGDRNSVIGWLTARIEVLREKAAAIDQRSRRVEEERRAVQRELDTGLVPYESETGEPLDRHPSETHRYDTMSLPATCEDILATVGTPLRADEIRRRVQSVGARLNGLAGRPRGAEVDEEMNREPA